MNRYILFFIVQVTQFDNITLYEYTVKNFLKFNNLKKLKLKTDRTEHLRKNMIKICDKATRTISKMCSQLSIEVPK